MSTVVILGTAVGLAMDAFAVAMAVSVALGRATARQSFRLSFHFGLFQFLMPVIGWLAGRSIDRYVIAWDHWVAFGLLSFIGGKAIYVAVRTDGEIARGDPTRGASLILLSIATSVDALAVGFSFAMLGVRIWYPSAVIGIVTAVITALGIEIGGRLGAGVGRSMEIVGGLVLIAIGAKIVVDHLG